MPQGVLCEVETCYFWVEGNKCDAKAIYVVNQKPEAKESEDTDCKTFEPKSH